MTWLEQALTGADNKTVAIGRLIGFVLALVLLMFIPIAAVASVMCRAVPVADWRDLLPALATYVAMIVAAIAGLIWGTNPTEPKPTTTGETDNG